MNETTFFAVVGILTGISLTCSLLGFYLFAKSEKKRKKAHAPAPTFREVYEDNAPKDDDYPIPTDDFT